MSQAEHGHHTPVSQVLKITGNVISRLIRARCSYHGRVLPDTGGTRLCAKWWISQEFHPRITPKTTWSEHARVQTVSGPESAFLTPEIRVLSYLLFGDSSLHREDVNEIEDQASPNRLRRSRTSRRHSKRWRVGAWTLQGRLSCGLKGVLSLFLCSFLCLSLCTCPQGLTGHSALVVNKCQTVLLIHSLYLTMEF